MKQAAIDLLLIYRTPFIRLHFKTPILDVKTMPYNKVYRARCCHDKCGNSYPSGSTVRSKCPSISKKEGADYTVAPCLLTTRRHYSSGSSAASRLMALSATSVSFSSAIFSSLSVCSSSGTASCKPSVCAKVRNVPYEAIS